MTEIAVIFVEKRHILPLQFHMSILEKITARKRERLGEAKLRTSLAELKSASRDMGSPRDFQKAIKRGSGPLRIIAEIKKASPSKGLIRKDFDHVAIASIYERKGVNAVSVITEEDYFQGRIDFLSAVKKTVSMPVLRKDFIIDEYQIYEARTNGADALLLIAALLETNQAAEYLLLSKDLGMSVLFEVHDFHELQKALLINAPVIGINNRDLKTMSIDLETSVRLRAEIPAGRITVSESGIGNKEDAEKIGSAGFDAILVGTCLMESRDIGEKIDQLRGPGGVAR